jgi:multiple sugar transport system substrate-binding protein
MAIVARLATVMGLACWAGAAMAQPVTVRMWMHEHPPRIAIDKAIIAEFEQANPDIKIQYDVIAVNEYSPKLLTAFAAGSGPDLFNNTSTLVTQYYNARIIAPIDYAAMGMADEAALLAKYQGAGFDGIRFQGRLHGVPSELSNWACFANNAIWQEAGLDPRKDWPKTWEELPAVAEKLTKRDANGVPVRRGFDFNWSIPGAFWYVPNTMIHQLGGNLIDEVAYKPDLESKAARRAFQYYQDWAGKLRLGGPQYTDSRTEFLAGKLGAECSFGVWGVPQMEAAKIAWTVLPVPKFADATSDNGMDEYAFYMMVNARSASPVQKAAWKFIRFYTDHAAKLFQGAGLFTPRAEVMESDAFKANPAAPFFVAELKRARFSPRVVGYTQVLDAILRGRDKLVQGEKIDDVMPVMNEEVASIMTRERARAASLVK